MPAVAVGLQALPAALLFGAVFAAVGLLALLELEEPNNGQRVPNPGRVQRRTRRFGIHPMNRQRDRLGFYNTTYRELRKDGARFLTYTRMTIQQFDNLLPLLRPSLRRYSIRRPLQPAMRLLIAIRFLASGNSVTNIALEYRIGRSTCNEVIKSTCSALWEILQPIYLRPPTQEEMVVIAEEFLRKWNMPNCLGAIDGKLIRIFCPIHSGSEFFSYKKMFAINLMACCDANHVFIYVNIGAQGSISDGGVFRASEFGSQIIDHTLPVPDPTILPNDDSGEMFPYFFIADEAFPQRVNLMRPYTRSDLAAMDHKIFNYRLSRARFTIENAFGRLSAKWRIFHRSIEARTPETGELYVKAAVVLHNYILKTGDPQQATCQTEDDGRMCGQLAEEARGNHFEDLPLNSARAYTREAARFKQKLATYLSSPAGSVPWQEERVHPQM